MSDEKFEKIARGLIELLRQQFDAIDGRNFGDFTSEELQAYELRSLQIQQLRSVLFEPTPPQL